MLKNSAMCSACVLFARSVVVRGNGSVCSSHMCNVVLVCCLGMSLCL